MLNSRQIPGQHGEDDAAAAVEAFGVDLSALAANQCRLMLTSDTWTKEQTRLQATNSTRSSWVIIGGRWIYSVVVLLDCPKNALLLCLCVWLACMSSGKAHWP